MKRLLSFFINILNFNCILIIFFFIFLIFRIDVCRSQIEKHTLDTLLTGNFAQDSINSDKYFEKGRDAYNDRNSQLALDYFLKCLHIRQAIYPVNAPSIGFAAARAGVNYKDLGYLNDAIECFQVAISANSHNYGNDTYRNGFPYTNIGNVYRQKGNFTDAILYHQEALSRFYNGDTVQYKQSINDTKYNLAEILFLSKRFDESLKIIYGCYNNTIYDQKACFLNLLGNIYANKKENIKADEYFRLAIKEIQTKISSSKDTSFLADFYTGYSLFLLDMKDYQGVKNNLQKAELLIRNRSHSREISNLYFTYGELYSKKPIDSNSLDKFQDAKSKNLDTALNFYQKAIIALSNNFNDTSPFSNPRLDSCLFASRTIQILQRKAEVFLELAQLNQNDTNQKQTYLEIALSTSLLASDLLNNMRKGTVSEESKISLTQLQNSTYSFTVRIASELFNLDEKTSYFEIALQNAERNKAASLLDNLSDENARQSSLIPDSLILKEENINDQVTFINQKIFEENQQANPNSLKISNYEQQLFTLNDEKSNLRRFLESNFKDYYQLKYLDEKMTLKDIRNRLAKDEVVIEYAFEKSPNTGFENNLFLFLVSKYDIKLKVFSVDSTFNKDIDETYRFLSANDFVNIPFEKYENYIESANRLYNILIKPFDEKLFNKQITIIPDGKLSYIPFDALIFNKPLKTEKLDFKNLDYLIRKYSFNYCYSLGLYLNKSKIQKHADKKLIAFAPTYGEYRGSANEEFNRLAPLSGIGDEVKSISKKIKSKLFVGDNATESNFKSNYKNFDILHFAMHAILNDSIPMFSKLAFSPETDTSNHEDGWLTTSELYNLKLNSRLAVLSACNTGSGVLMEGEGVISLARGFFYAGCPSVVMTLWEVEDRSGAEIMSEFYDLLNAGKKKNVALRLAKLKHLENADPVTAHPHIWLSYVTIGKSDALYSGKIYFFFIIVLFAIALIIVDQLFKNKKARKFRA